MARLKILTWNVWMMPPIVHASPKNAERAAAIAEILGNADYDILCLQKVFDDNARRVLREGLSRRYPSFYGPANNPPGMFRINSGVWILSRRPLHGYRETEFEERAGIETFSRKGAMMLDGEIDGARFQIVATHLQGDDSPQYRPDRQAVRDKQIRQIADRLIAPNVDAGVPLFVCGDMCTPHREEIDHFLVTDAFLNMTQVLGVETADEEYLTLEDDRAVNDLADDDRKRRAQLDYIMVRKNGIAVTGTWRRHIYRHATWDAPGKRQDLSYRYALGAEFDWPTP